MTHQHARTGSDRAGVSSVGRDTTVALPVFNQQHKDQPYTARVFVRAAGNHGLVAKGFTDRNKYLRTLETGLLIMTPEQGRCPAYKVACPLICWKDGSVLYFVEAPDETLQPFDFHTVEGLYRFAVTGRPVRGNVLQRSFNSELQHAVVPVLKRLINAPIP